MKRTIQIVFIASCCSVISGVASAQNIAKIDSLRALISKTREDTNKVLLLNAIGGAYQNNFPDSTIIICEKAKTLSVKIGFKRGEADAYNNIGIAYDNKGELQKSLDNYFMAEKLYRQDQNALGIARAFNDIGIIYYEQGKHDSALTYLFNSLHIKDSLHERKTMANVLSNIGLVYQDEGNIEKCTEYLFKAVAIDEELGNKQGMADSYLNIGEIYQSENIEKSNEFLKKALDLQQQIGDKEGMIYSYDDLGSNLRKQHNPAAALEYFSKALVLAEQIDLPLMSGSIHLNIGGINEEQGNYNKAFQEYTTGLQILEALGENKYMSKAHINLGQIYTLLGQPDNAIAELNKALSIATAADLKPQKQYSYEGLAKAYEKKNDFRSAYTNYKLAAAIKDSLMSTEKTKAILTLRTKYETQKKDEEIALLNAKNLLHESENRKQKILRNAFVIGFVLVGLLAFVLYNGFRRKQKVNTELAAMNNVIRQQKEQVEETLSELKRSEAQLVQSEKMASLGQLTAGVAHEINNPINFVSGNINPLKRNFDELVEALKKNNSTLSADLNYVIEESQQLLSGIEIGSKRTAEIVKELRNFSHPDEDSLKQANINEGLESTLLLVQNKMNERNIELVKSLGEIPRIECYAGQLNQVWMNLLTNAIDADEKDGKIFVTTSSENNFLKISIRDTGKGMSDDVKQKIFDPFFTTKDVGQGTGLGLSISYGIIEKHNGKIEVKSEIGKGTEFIISLPIKN